MITAVRGLDVDAVRSQIASHNQGIAGAASPHELAAFAGDVAIIDIRLPEEFAEAHAPGAVNIPLGQLPRRLHDVPADGTVHVMRLSGGRSGTSP